MKFALKKLTLFLKKGSIDIPFSDVSYFHGKMGAGKTSIARLIDYCLGGRLEYSPALQSEFVSVELTIALKDTTLSVERPRDSDRAIARWSRDKEEHQLSIPTRKALGVVLPNTSVETLSDLIFFLSDIVPPKVRTSKIKDDADRRRLSIRDLWWYCYLDQDEIDSTFFHLDKVNDGKQYKSRDVIRFLLKFHDEKVAEIEAELDKLRGERQALASSASSLRKVLKEVGAESEDDLLFRVEALRNEADQIAQELANERAASADVAEINVHAADQLRERARALGNDIAAIDKARSEIQDLLAKEQRHLNEIETLVIKFRRSNSAKEILQGVSFSQCPRCAQRIPQRDTSCCGVCGQADHVASSDPVEDLLLERDAKGRMDELKEIIQKRHDSLETIALQKDGMVLAKSRVERELNDVSRQYDSAYLSRALTRERERSALLQQADQLGGMLRFPRLVAKQEEEVERISIREGILRAERKSAREQAERDTSNLDRLKELFLDCLIRTSLPGISEADTVDINSSDFLPRIWAPETVQVTVTSFANMSSGGKKTLFKSCFAVAIHRLATEVGGTLPELLIIDSPMKNISERENKQQFENFHRMLYQLKRDELSTTQIVLIDKEYFSPAQELGIDVYERHMQPNELNTDNPHPPLIPYYQGH